MRSVTRFVALVLVVSISTLAPVARVQTGSTAASCDRKCLAGILDNYFDSIAKRDPALLPVAPDVRVTENAAPLKFGEGLWQRGASTVSRMDALDVESGQVASMAVIAESGKNVIEMVRLKVLQRRVVEVETLVVRPGEGQRSDPEAMAKRPHPFADDVPAAERGTREQLIAAGGAYLDALAGSGPSYVPPPIADAAIRVENGAQATGVARPGQPVVTLAERFRTTPGTFVSPARIGCSGAPLSACGSAARHRARHRDDDPASAAGRAGRTAAPCEPEARWAASAGADRILQGQRRKDSTHRSGHVRPRRSAIHDPGLAGSLSVGIYGESRGR